MALYPDRNYTSDASQFLQKLKKDHPELEAAQRAGRALLWDKPLDARRISEQAECQQGRVPQKAYPYQTEAAQ